ncbi:MAG: hypothetical protein HN341_12490 [Verrucomicrobia bacterium]|jgi:uncharacterized protein|nr:hypothetical protein [Verrucomicrobiota bacterium]
MRLVSQLALATCIVTSSFAADVEPIQVLMITGGGWHDYETQAPLLKTTIESQVNAEVTIKWTSTEEHKVGQTENKLPEVFKGDFCKGYDVVFHNHCHVGFQDDNAIDAVIDSHIKNKVGVIMTHGSFHTWMRTSREAWDRICGLNSTSHGQHAAIRVEVVNNEHPVMKALGVKGWTTKEGELYRTTLKETTTALAKGTTLKGKEHTQDCIFSHTNTGIRMFGTTLGHHTSTMQQAEYHDMIGFAVLWAAGKLDEDGKASAGYRK